MEPFEHTTKFLNGASSEIISAISALNMEPQPITPKPKNLSTEQGFLSETDHMAKHSVEHMRAALHTINKAYAAVEAVRWALIELLPKGNLDTSVSPEKVAAINEIIRLTYNI